MIEHIWTVLCTRTSTDRDSNNISLFDVLEQLNLLGPLPDAAARVAFPLQFELVSLWTRSDMAQAEESIARNTLFGPNGAEILAQEYPVSLTEHTRLRTQQRSFGFPLAGIGRYFFTVELRRENVWERVARIPVQIESVALASDRTTDYLSGESRAC